MEAARGRYDVVEQADGSVTQKVIQLPQRTASAWVLERVFGFTKPAGTGPAEAEVDALTALRRGTAPLPKTLVFVSRKGSPWLRGNALRRIWWPLLDRAGIPHCGFHAARRGHISELLANGAPLKAVSARVGHADSGLTVNVYQQVRSDADRQLADLTGRLLAGQSA
jgi:integrase